MAAVGPFASAPHVGGVPLLLLHLLDEGVRLLLGQAALVADDLFHDVVDVLGHHLGVSAHVQVAALLAQQSPHVVGVLPEAVRHVNLRRERTQMPKFVESLIFVKMT